VTAGLARAETVTIADAASMFDAFTAEVVSILQRPESQYFGVATAAAKIARAWTVRGSATPPTMKRRSFHSRKERASPSSPQKRQAGDQVGGCKSKRRDHHAVALLHEPRNRK
jgi:hypothetical protein